MFYFCAPGRAVLQNKHVIVSHVRPRGTSGTSPDHKHRTPVSPPPPQATSAGGRSPAEGAAAAFPHSVETITVGLTGTECGQTPGQGELPADVTTTAGSLNSALFMHGWVCMWGLGHCACERCTLKPECEEDGEDSTGVTQSPVLWPYCPRASSGPGVPSRRKALSHSHNCSVKIHKQNQVK